MAADYEVMESKVWRSKSGRMVSMFGALPWYSDAQKIAEGWECASQGWTVYNRRDNQVGIGRQPWPTQEQAQAWVDTRDPKLLPA